MINYKTNDLLALCLSETKWTLVNKEGKGQYFEKASILIHNEWFHLIKLTNTIPIPYSKLIVLFNDQMTLDQRRMMHLMS